jgi:capsular polysaccharide biosynthesis protein
MHQYLSDYRPPMLDRQSVENIGAGVMACGYSGNRWFGHFLMDTMPLLLMSRDVAHERRAEVVSTPIVTDQVGQRQAYVDYLGIPPRMVTRAHFDELVIIDPLGLNSYHRTKTNDMRRLVRERSQMQSSGHSVYLRRGRHGEVRNPENEAEIESILREHDCQILEPEKMSVETLVSALLGARLVVGVEGSQLAHAFLAAADRAAILTLQPPARFGTPLKSYCDHIGFRWAFLIGESRENNNYVIDADDFRRTLDLVL